MIFADLLKENRNVKIKIRSVEEKFEKKYEQIRLKK